MRACALVRAHAHVCAYILSRARLQSQPLLSRASLLYCPEPGAAHACSRLLYCPEPASREALLIRIDLHLVSYDFALWHCRLLYCPEPASQEAILIRKKIRISCVLWLRLMQPSLLSRSSLPRGPPDPESLGKNTTVGSSCLFSWFCDGVLPHSYFSWTHSYFSWICRSQHSQSIMTIRSAI